MKKLAIVTVIALLGLTAFIACGDCDAIITTEQLPPAAKTYLEQNYPDRSILYAKKDAELFQTTYKVHLDGGLEVEFDKDGQIKDMDIDD